MRYFKLTIAYDGTDFHGWQFQTDKPTIQGEIVSVLRRLTQENVQLLSRESRSAERVALRPALSISIG